MFLKRLFLEFFFISSLIFLVFFYLKLFRDVVKLRRKDNISFGNAKNPKLERAIRAHANFIEYVPLSLILSLFLYFHNFLILSCFSIFLLTLGRIYHKRGITNEEEKKEKFKFRMLGMRFTTYSFYCSIIGLIFYLGQMLFLLIQNQ